MVNFESLTPISYWLYITNVCQSLPFNSYYSLKLTWDFHISGNIFGVFFCEFWGLEPPTVTSLQNTAHFVYTLR